MCFSGCFYEDSQGDCVSPGNCPDYMKVPEQQARVELEEDFLDKPPF